MVQLSTSWSMLNHKTVSYYSSFTGDFQLWARIIGSQDIANNRTKVEYQWYVEVTYGWITDDNAQDYLTNVGWNAAQRRTYSSNATLLSWTGWINHNADGTGGGSCSGRTYMPYMGVDTDWVSASYTLPTIPRASVPTGSPNPLTIGSSGATLTVNTNRKASSFMHTVKVQCGSWSWTSTARSVGASTTVTVPYTVIAQFSATSKTATATVTCTTYSGTTQIGSVQTCSVTFQVNSADDHANVGTITVQDTNARTSAVTQDNSIYIANISTLEATIPLTVSGSYTELASAVVTCGTKSQTYALSGTSASLTFEFDKVNASSLTVKVIDKRGNSVTGTKSWTLIAYQPVTAVATVGRPSATGSVGVGQVTGMAYGGMFGATQNSLSITIDFKKHEDADYDPQGTETDTLALSQDGYNSWSDALTFAYTLDYQYQYDIKFTVSDLFSTATYVAQLMQGLPVLSWDETEVDVWGDLHIHDRDNPTVWQDVMQGFDAVLEHGGQKNLLRYSAGTTTTNGITFTVQSDGSVKVTGTASATAYFTIGAIQTVNGMEYIMTGCPSTGGANKYRMTAIGYGYDYGDGYTFTGDGSSHDITIDVYPAAGNVNITFYPMIRDARIASETFTTPAGRSANLLVGSGNCIYAQVGKVVTVMGTVAGSNLSNQTKFVDSLPKALANNAVFYATNNNNASYIPCYLDSDGWITNRTAISGSYSLRFMFSYIAL